MTDFFRISCELSTWSACPTTSVGTCWRATLTGRCTCGGTGGTRSPTSSNTATTYVLLSGDVDQRQESSLFWSVDLEWQWTFICTFQQFVCLFVVVYLFVCCCLLGFFCFCCCLYVCLLFKVPVENISLIWISHYYCWKENNLGYWSALTALDQGGIIIVPYNCFDMEPRFIRSRSK